MIWHMLAQVFYLIYANHLTLTVTYYAKAQAVTI